MSSNLDSFRFPSTNLVNNSNETETQQDSFPNNDADYPLPSPNTYPIRRASFIDPNRLYSIDLSNVRPDEDLTDLRRRYSMNPSKISQPSETVPTFTRRSSVLSTFLPNPSLNVATAPQVSEIPRLFEEVRQSIDIVHDEISKGKDKIIHHRKHKKKHIRKAKKKAVIIEEHEMTSEKVCELYSTSFNIDNPQSSFGLSKEVATQRLKINGPNIFTPPKREKFIWKVIDQFTTLFSLLMLFAGLLSFINVAIDRTPASYPNIFLGAILWFVVIMNATITLWQEHSSEKVIAAFLALQTSNCMVIREGNLQRIDVSEVVVGDLVNIEPGTKVPADLRLLFVNSLKMDNSSLTGESEPQSRTVESTSHNPLESANLAFFGTIVVEGSAIGIVIRTGSQTVIGQIALMAQSSPLKTPLRRQIDTFVRTLGSMSLVLAVLFFVIGLALGNPWFQCVLFSTGIIAANIPQGLIATMTLCLTVSAKRLSDINVLVKKLEHVETLGGVNVICSDKTGTLTQNRMTVVEQWCDGSLSDVYYQNRLMKSKPNAESLPNFANIEEDNISTPQKLIRCAALCSKTIFVESEENLNKPILDRECIGDASEIALVKFVETRTEYANLVNIRNGFPKLYDIPFNSKNKWMLTIHSCQGQCFDNANSLMLLKGAPERVFDKCDSIYLNGQVISINDDLRQHFQDAYSFFASKGQRVLGLAQRFTTTDLVNLVKEKEETGTVKIGGDPTGSTIAVSDDSNQQLPLNGFTFIGLLGLTDPPKVGVTEAITKCKHAGIQVVMVTGDHPTTAKAIAKQVGILESNSKTRDDIAAEEGCPPEIIEYNRPDVDAVVLHGEEIDKLKDIEWKYILKKKQIVFSRTSPQQKLVIVSKFQEAGNCVAVTGDGVNDSPALKKADIGIAMNISGSDVSKEAAAIILMDDNFASIVNGVEEGRLIFDNLKKSISYTLIHLLPELCGILVIIIGMPAAITGLLVLCIDLGTELVAAISLSYETKESDIMTVPPRPKSELLVGVRVLSFSYLQVGVIETLAAFTSFFFALAYYGIPPHYLFQSVPGFFSLSTTKYLFITETGLFISPAAQWNILATAQTSYFLAIVVCQWFALVSSRTRRTSLLMQGLFSNLAIYLGIIFSVCIACIVIYVPFIGDYIFGTRYMIWLFWLLPIFYGILIILYDEYRKLLIRELHFHHLLW